MAACSRVDVFSGVVGQGNPAGVVLDADSLDAAAMQRIAAAVGASETAFVSGPSHAPSIRWFTPTVEVDFCGHATLAAAHVLGAEDRPVEFTYRTGTARVHADVLGGDVIYWLSRPAPDLADHAGDRTLLLAALGGPRLGARLPVMVSSDNDLLLPLATWEDVEALAPDTDALAAAASALGLRGIAAFAVPGPGNYEVRLRFFAPHLGIAEDPVTGSVHGAVLVYLHQCELVGGFPEELRALSRQGPPGGRQGDVWLRLWLHDDRPTVADVGGQAVTAGEGAVDAG